MVKQYATVEGMNQPRFQFGLRYLYKHLGQALQNLPFEITNHNRVIAVVISKEEYDRLKEDAWKYEELSK
jgi:hypothetical protein